VSLARLGDDGGEVEDGKGEIAVSFEANLLESGGAANAAGEDAPGDFLRHDDARGRLFALADFQCPA
jgi:hypothetical protein